MCKLFDFFLQTARVYFLDCVDNLRVKRGPPFVEQSPVRHFIGKSMLEGVFQLGEKLRFIQKFGGLEVSEITA